MNWKTAGLALIAALALLATGWFGAALLLKPPAPPKPKNPFTNWAAIIVAGDWRAHSGAPSMVFDNARRDLAKKFVALGFDRANTRQFSAAAASFPYDDVQPSAEGPITSGLAAVTARARGGCLLYFTSHGTQDGIVLGERVVGPEPLAAKISQYCGDRPTVVILSACFSGVFVPALQGPHRIVFTAARWDRTSFGCGEENQYTFFDTCMLSQIDKVASFPALADKVKDCVATREAAMNEEETKAVAGKAPVQPALPSEPQFVADEAMAGLRWK
ncbi:MAG: peptidase C13 [Alphaproteobacteria bacterium]|nr:peptidase C13 [Alphaproteobacteria bacterium]